MFIQQQKCHWFYFFYFKLKMKFRFWLHIQHNQRSVGTTTDNLICKGIEIEMIMKNSIIFIAVERKLREQQQQKYRQKCK